MHFFFSSISTNALVSAWFAFYSESKALSQTDRTWSRGYEGPDVCVCVSCCACCLVSARRAKRQSTRQGGRPATQLGPHKYGEGQGAEDGTWSGIGSRAGSRAALPCGTAGSLLCSLLGADVLDMYVCVHRAEWAFYAVTIYLFIHHHHYYYYRGADGLRASLVNKRPACSAFGSGT